MLAPLTNSCPLNFKQNVKLKSYTNNNNEMCGYISISISRLTVVSREANKKIHISIYHCISILLYMIYCNSHTLL